MPEDFSLFFLDIDMVQILPGVSDYHYHRQKMVDMLIDHLNRKNHTVAWETDRGIAIISDLTPGIDRKEKEMELAEGYLTYVSASVPDVLITVGIANYSEGWINFANRLKNAETAVRIGEQVWPDKDIYHYENCGIYQVLAPFAVTDGASDYVVQMISPLLPHPNLLETLEKILAGLSFKEIGVQLYLHHKTIQLRKQRIEQILNVSLDCYETRTALATALQLLKILKIG